MYPAEDRTERLILLCVPALIVALGCGASLLPSAARAELLYCIAAWTCLSVPLAVLIGHCALGEE